MKRALTVFLGSLFLLTLLYWLLYGTGKRNPSAPQAIIGADHAFAASSNSTANSRIPQTTALMPLASNASSGIVSTSTPPTSASPPRKRAWDPQFLATLNNSAEGDPIRFELV